MEKEALIDIILNDLKEVSTLLSTFKGKNEINNAFINLTRTKIANINEELSLLEQLNKQSEIKKNPEPEVKPNISGSLREDLEAIANSSKSIISEEAEGLKENYVQQEEKIPETKNEDITQVIEEKETEPVADKTEKKHKPNKEIEGKHLKKERKTDKTTVLGEQIKKDSRSVNETIATKKENQEDIKQIGKPVSDVRKAFGLNDRFLYQRELFNGNIDLFNQIMDQINQLDSYENAVKFLQSNFKWEQNSEITESFYKNIKRRFI